jgi:peptide/nickel transport system permease protein
MDPLSWGAILASLLQAVPAGLDRADPDLRPVDPFKRKLGLYGKLFDSTIGMIGLPS